MKDYIFYIQLIMLTLNVAVLIYLMSADKVYLKTARILIIAAIFIGTLANFGKFTFWNVLFAATPLLTLINLRQNGQAHRFIERIRGGNFSNRKSLQNLQGSRKALSKQKA